MIMGEVDGWVGVKGSWEGKYGGVCRDGMLDLEKWIRKEMC